MSGDYETLEINQPNIRYLPWLISLFLIILISRKLSPKVMPTNEELEKRIETLEKEVQHLKAVLQYQMRNKKK